MACFRDVFTFVAPARQFVILSAGKNLRCFHPDCRGLSMTALRMTASPRGVTAECFRAFLGGLTSRSFSSIRCDFGDRTRTSFSGSPTKRECQRTPKHPAMKSLDL